MRLKLIVAILIFVLAGLFQNTHVFAVFGVKPNLLLIALISLSFFIKDIRVYLNFVLASILISSVGGGISTEQIVLAVLTLAVFPAGRYFRWQPTFNNLLIIGVATPIFYLLTAPAFLLSGWQVVSGEIVYNLLWGFVLFEIFSLCLKTNSILRT